MIKPVKYLFSGFLLCCCLLHGQQHKVDSLLSLLKNTGEDTTKVTVLNALSERIWLQGDYEKAKPYANEALALAEQKLTISKGSEKNAWLKGKANALNNIAIVYRYQGNYTQALKNHFAALKIREAINDKKGIARSYLGIGSIYNFIGNNEEALNYKFKSKKIYEEIGDKDGIANVCSHIGLIYYEQGRYEEAKGFYTQSIQISMKTGNIKGMADVYNYFGLIYEKTGDYKQAIDNFNLCLYMKLSLGLKDGVIEANLFLGLVHIKIKKYKEAAAYLNEALTLAKQVGSKEHQKNVYLGLTRLDSANTDFKSAFEHYKLYVACRDGLVNQKTSEKITQMQAQFEDEKKEQIRALKEQEREVKRRAEEKQQRTLLYSVTAGLLLMFLLAVVIFRGYRQKQRSNQELIVKNEIIERQKQLVEEKQKEVMDSIRYARRIQTALITSEKYIEKSLKRLGNDLN